MLSIRQAMNLMLIYLETTLLRLKSHFFSANHHVFDTMDLNVACFDFVLLYCTEIAMPDNKIHKRFGILSRDRFLHMV